jgi:hypothetical protein
MWNEAAVAHPKVIYWHLFGGAEVSIKMYTGLVGTVEVKIIQINGLLYFVIIMTRSVTIGGVLDNWIY